MKATLKFLCILGCLWAFLGTSRAWADCSGETFCGMNGNQEVCCGTCGAGSGVSTCAQSGGIFYCEDCAYAPVLDSLSPNTKVAGSPAFTLTAHGSDFRQGDTLTWNGALVPTIFIRDSELTADISAAAVAQVGTAEVRINSPGRGTSYPLIFTITCIPAPFVGGAVSPASVAAGGAYTMTCDYGVQSGYVIPSGNCDWVGWTGTQSNYNCHAGTTPGTYSNTCRLGGGDNFCPSTDAINDLTVSYPPVINSFTATPDTIAKGQISTLAWDVSNAVTVTIDQSIGPVAANGSQGVSPAATTIYSLTATNSVGVSMTRTVTVKVACNNLNCPTPPNVCLPDQTCVTPAAPVINSFTATPDTIAKGQSSSLAWNVSNAVTIWIDQGIGTVNAIGNTSVSPTVTTIYTLTATNAAGVSASRAVTVTVACNNLNCPNPPNICLPDQTCVTPAAPVINSFTATPDTIARGQSSQLAWTTTNAVSVTIDQGVGPQAVNGNTNVSPIATTIYTLTATNAANVSVTRQVTVTVACNNLNCPTPPNICLPDQTCVTPAPPVINSFTATPDTIAKGQSSTLAWDVSNAVTVTIDQSVGPVAANGSQGVSPAATTIYTLTATNSANVSVTRQVTVTVACNNLNCPTPPNICLPDQTCLTPPAPVINSFTATPDTIAKGQSSQLAWTTTNAVSVTIDQGVGVQSVNGNTNVSPSVTTIYTLTATNAANVSVTRTVTVTVACNNLNCPTPPNICLPDQTCITPAAPVINSFTATPDTIAKGQNSTLAWDVSNAAIVTIDQSIGPVAANGSQTVSPTVTTLYTLRAANASNVTATRTVTVTVSCNPINCPAPNICQADGSCLPPGASDIDHVTVEPDGRTIQLGDALPFVAHAFTATNVEILGIPFSWQVQGTGGNVSGIGLFRAAGGFYGSRIYTVTATVPNGKNGSARVTVISPSPFASDICGAFAYPVPYKSSSGRGNVTFTGLGPGSKIRIFTNDGRIVRTLFSQDGEDVPWDLRNNDGDKVASWVYPYRIEQNGPCGKKEGKLVIIQ